MSPSKDVLQEMYKHFNEKKTDLVINMMTDDVVWANGMEGGYVYGRGAVSKYWEKQFMGVSSNVTPLEIDKQNEGVKIKVHQVVHDVQGNLLADEYVYHYFYFKDDKISRFEIEK